MSPKSVEKTTHILKLEDSSNVEKDKIYSLKMVFQELHDVKQITFPSKYRQAAQETDKSDLYT